MSESESKTNRKLTALEQYEVIKRALQAATGDTAAAKRLNDLLETDVAVVGVNEFNEGEITFFSEFGEFTTIWKEGHP